MTEAQIKYMVDRFLGWKLPESFSPDCGISFARTHSECTGRPQKYEPSGTNLLDATQATVMVRYILEGMPGVAECGHGVKSDDWCVQCELVWYRDLLAAAQRDVDRYQARISVLENKRSGANITSSNGANT